MSTKTPDHNGPDLEEFFAAARANAPEPPADFLTRIAADAGAEIDRREAMSSGGGTVLGRLLGAFRRHGVEAGGLAAATLAGLWIGIAPPSGVEAPLAALWGDEAETSAALVDPVSAYDLAFLGD
ncbi:hypothetical protein OCH239_20645 [Roseivivax halodurans JCM 10272]|uniref:Dihydroorotate dehydrogenase n=1 Tax=Roseivivax halodurans JCM 10272 TaxID=1449350 RepID=X7EI01_9RHOB|nr:hypothetical protein [Roseivivax halodurans]ETX14768.1 hypothetical protein OCH239_20645 [Roseivivax halodurans JCM 10272]